VGWRGLAGDVVRSGLGAALRVTRLPTGDEVERLSRQLSALTEELQQLTARQEQLTRVDEAPDADGPHAEDPDAEDPDAEDPDPGR
jgi:hypothetical protein